MLSFQLVRNIPVVALLFTVIATPSAEAQSALEGFFRKNGAETVFSPEIQQTQQRDLVMLREKEQAEKEQEIAQKPPVEKKEEKAPAKPKDHRLEQPKTPEDILKAYGDPSTQYPVAATEDAPGPFKAMYAAMNAGDDELAFKYAVQYVKFREQLRSKNSKAVSLMGQAQRKAGLLPAGSWPDDEAHAELAYLQDIEIPGIDDAQETALQNSVNVTAETRELVKKLKEAKYDLFSDEKEKIVKDIKNWEEQERTRTRKELASTLPVSASKTLDILVFFRFNHDESRELATEIQKLYRKSKGIAGVNVATFNIGPFSQVAVNSFHSATKTDFPILPGSTVAENMGLQAVPAVIFVTREGESHLEVGFQNYYRLDEIRKIMQGEKL